MKNDMSQSIQRLVYILEDWANWQKGYSGIKGFPSRSIGLQSGYVSSSFEDLCDSVDNAVCVSVDTAIDDLAKPEAAAIRKRYGVASVFRFPRDNYAQLLSDAHFKLMEELPKKGVVI